MSPLGYRCIVGLAAVLLLAGCASIPLFESVDGTAGGGAATQNPAPRLSNARGPLTVKQSKAVLDRLRRQTPDADVLGRHLAFSQEIAASPLTVGNKVTVLRDGAASFDAIFAAISAAKHSIHLEYFIFEDVLHDGRQLVDLLVEKQAAGVQVNLIYDAAGSIGTPHEAFDRLRDAGVEVLQFNPLDPFKGKADYAPNDRDHRKIMVVDGAVAVIGGVNLSQVYSSNIFSSARVGRLQGLWRDTNLRLEGEAVADLQRLFLATWERQRGKPLPPGDYFPAVAAAPGNQVVGIIGSTPTHTVPIYYMTLLSAIRNAESRIWVTTAYFVPTREERADMKAAARRGVDVRLMLPRNTDSEVALNIGRAHYASLLRSGVRVFEIRDVILHSKTVVVDGVWSAVGSSNFDGRSVLFNDEVDAVVLGRETGGQLEASFETDMRNADEITQPAWSKRPLERKLRETYSRLWSYWM
jgi:cardiolipin synthase